MLVIRLQRTGRKGHAQFRVVVQDSRRTPTSGKIVAQVGTYDPHSKAVKIDNERAQHYLDHGAQPSDRVALLLKKEGVKLPTWVSLPLKQEGTIRHPEKLRRNRPAAPVEEAPAEVVADEVAETSTEVPAEVAADAVGEKPVKEETAAAEPEDEKAAE